MPAQPGLFTVGAAPSSAALKAAQARLMADKSLQFTFGNAPPPPTEKPPPEWMKGIGDFFGAVGHLLGYVFWGGVILAAAAFLIWIGLEVARARWPERFKKKPKPAVQEPDWRPEATVARALLDEADRLAAAGEYAMAARLLLHRSIEHIEGRRPKLVRPAYTAREIAALNDIPSGARPTFASIAEIVEHSFFGGRDVDAAGFAACRRAYEDFAFPGAWA